MNIHSNDKSKNVHNRVSNLLSFLGIKVAYLYNIDEILLLVKCTYPFSVICSPENPKTHTHYIRIWNLKSLILSCMTSFQHTRDSTQIFFFEKQILILSRAWSNECTVWSKSQHYKYLKSSSLAYKNTMW